MGITNLKKFLYFLFPVLILAASCQKGVDIDLNNPPPLPENVKDSTTLIKSIKLITFDPSSGLAYDSIKENYFYDTVNRKIILTFDQTASSPDYVPFIGIEHAYDVNGLLINLVYKYENGSTPAGDDMTSVKLDYDAGKVLQKITFHYFNGDIKITLLKKTMLLLGKYQLNWTEPLYIFSSGDTANVSAVFDETGKLTRNEYSYSYNTVGGGEAYTKIIHTDSIYYDMSGSVSKVMSNYIDTLRQENKTFMGGEFISRHTKGDQLFNMRQVLLNGIANMPFGEDLFDGGISGLLSFFQDGYEPLEYSKYPFQTAKVYNSQTEQYDSFTGVSDFDSKDRLIKFRGFLNDVELEPYQFEISYYK